MLILIKLFLNGKPVFNDHIIRSQEEMNQIADYIENNPALWKSDKFYSE